MTTQSGTTPTPAPKRYEHTDDANDPCNYCVQWQVPDGVDSMEAAYDDSAVPTLADGTVAARVYRGVHPECDAAVLAYVEMSSVTDGGPQ